MLCILEGEVGVYTAEQERNSLRFSLIKKIKENQCFGEQCLSSKSDQKWEYKCLSSECCLLIISRRDLKRLFSSIKKEEILENLKFFSSLNAFGEYNSNLLMQIYSNSSELKFQRNHSVFSEGDESNHIYIIKSGYFLVKSSLSEAQNQSKSDQIKIQQLLDPTNHSVKFLQKKKTLSKEQKIVIWGEKELFGEEDALEDKLRSYSVICESTEGELIKICKDFFISNIMQEETSKEVILKSLQQKLKLFQKKSENAVKQLYDSDLSKFYAQQQMQNLPEPPMREILQTNTNKANNNNSISNPKNISFKAMIKQKLIGYDQNLNFSQLNAKKDSNQNPNAQQNELVIPNINELINTSQVHSQGDLTTKNNNSQGNTPGSSSRGIRKGYRSNSQISSFQSQGQSFTQSIQPYSNKSLLDTIKKSTLDNNQKQEFESELKRLMLVEPSDNYWLQNQIENVNQESVPKEMLMPPEPFCTDGKSMEQTPQVKKFYHELKRNFFLKYDGKNKKSFNEFAQMRHYIKHRGVINLIEEDMARYKNAPFSMNYIKIEDTSPKRQRKSPNGEVETAQNLRVQNIIKNKILKGDDTKFNQFRSRSTDLVHQFPKSATLLHIQESDSDLEEQNLVSANLDWNPQTITTTKTSLMNSPSKKDFTIKKKVSIQTHFTQNLKKEVSNPEDIVSQQKQQDQIYKLIINNDIESMPDLNEKGNQAFSFSQNAQKQFLGCDLQNSPMNSSGYDVTDTKDTQISTNNKRKSSRVQSMSYNILPSNTSLNLSPLKQKSSQDDIKGSLSPHTANLKKKYYVMKQRQISPTKLQKIQSLNTLSVQQIKNELSQIEQSNSSMNTYKKNLNFSQQMDTSPGPITDQLNTETIQTERIKPMIRSQSVNTQFLNPNTGGGKSLREMRQLNRSQSPSNTETQNSIKYINFSEICQKIETSQQNDVNQSKQQIERSSSLNNQYTIKVNNLRQQFSQNSNTNNESMKSVSPPQRKRSAEKGNQQTQNNKPTFPHILNQCFQAHYLNMKQKIQEKQSKQLIIEQDNKLIRLKTDGDEETQSERNQHFSITNKFFDKLEKKRIQGNKSARLFGIQPQISNNSQQTVNSVTSKVILQKRLINNVGNSNILNSFDVSKIKKVDI